MNCQRSIRMLPAFGQIVNNHSQLAEAAVRFYIRDENFLDGDDIHFARLNIQAVQLFFRRDDFLHVRRAVAVGVFEHRQSSGRALGNVNRAVRRNGEHSRIFDFRKFGNRKTGGQFQRIDAFNHRRNRRRIVVVSGDCPQLARLFGVGVIID